jgi:hypothetical protein
MNGKQRKRTAGRPPKQTRKREKKSKKNTESNDAFVIENALENFMLDSGRLSHPEDTKGILNEMVTQEIRDKLVLDWKHHMELKVFLC